jgi:hypothetical protein
MPFVGHVTLYFGLTLAHCSGTSLYFRSDGTYTTFYFRFWLLRQLFLQLITQLICDLNQNQSPTVPSIQ